ncbi:MAG: ribonuclease HII [Proteobacteria bacterium]|nr:ribonuclease HII [Pseudomonadota bacterium]
MIAGVDEVGRGPLAGPVLAVAIIIDTKGIEGIKDSKKLSSSQREALSVKIRKQAKAWAFGVASVIEIDKINILNASLLAMQRAVANLSIVPDRIMVDGNRCPHVSMPAKAIIGGDDIVPQISAASIVAKVMRDYLMCVFDKHYPEYGFAKHKGYATKDHLKAIQQYGICAIHRKSFAPIKTLAASVV